MKLTKISFLAIVVVVTGLLMSIPVVANDDITNHDIIYHDISQGYLVISDDGVYSVSGTTTNYTIRVVSGCSPTVILNNVDIDVSSTPYKCAFLIDLDSPGHVVVEIANNTTNSLKSGSYFAGIDKSNSLGSESNMVGTLEINGGVATSDNTGTLYAQGGIYAAGIGGGTQKSSGEIIINGGRIATRSNGLQYDVGSGCAASIGGGGGSSAGKKYTKVIINGGYINATTGSYSAAIGTGDWNASGTAIVTINGGYIFVNNSNATTSNYYAIGGGFSSNAEVTVNGGTVYNLNTDPTYFIGASETLTKSVVGGSFNADISYLLDTTKYKTVYSDTSELFTVVPVDYYLVSCFLDDNYYDSFSLAGGSSISEIPQPEMAGYTFNGWYSDSALTNLITIMPENNINLYGSMVSEAAPCTITLDANGGAVETSTLYVEKQGTYGELPTPTKTGYTFEGWYTDSTGGNLVTSDTTVTVSDDHTLYARWNLNAPDVSKSDNVSVIYDGSYHSISVTATQYAGFAYTYQWYKGGNLIDGATGASLNVKDVINSGGYTCLVTVNDETQTKTTVSEEINVEIKKREIKLTANSDSKTYDGTTLYIDGYSITSGSFVDGEGFDTVTVTGNRKNVGFTFTSVTDYTFNENTDSDNYYLILYPGKVTINKAAIEITVTANSANKTYDGIALTDSEYVIDGEPATDDIVVVNVTGSITNAGSIDNEVASVKVYNSGSDVTENYVITAVNGTLTVNKREIKITANSNSKTYDGTPLTDSGYTLDGDLVLGNDVVVNITSTITNAGSIDNEVTFVIIKNGESDVTENYEITTVDGTLTIEKRNITITANSNIKTYDKTELIDGGYSITAGSFVEGEGFDTVTVEGVQVNAGVSNNVITEYTLTAASDIQNYNITTENGILAVDFAQGAIIDISDIGKVSDGLAVDDPEVVIVGDGSLSFEYYLGETKLESAPSKAGTYSVKVILCDGDNYLGAEATEEFVIKKIVPKIEVNSDDDSVAPNNLDNLNNPTDEPTKGVTQEEYDSASDIKLSFVTEKINADSDEQKLLEKSFEDIEVGMLLDVKLIKNVTYANGNELQTELNDLNDIISFSVPLSDEFMEMEGFTVCRVYDDKVTELSTTPNENGEYIEFQEGSIIIHSKYFATYAIGFNKVISPSTMGNSNTPFYILLISISIISLLFVTRKKVS